MKRLRAKLEEENYQSMVRNVDLNSARKVADFKSLSADCISFFFDYKNCFKFNF